MRSPGIRLHKLALFGWAVVVTAVLLLLSLPVLAGISSTKIQVNSSNIFSSYFLFFQFKIFFFLIIYLFFLYNDIWGFIKKYVKWLLWLTFISYVILLENFLYFAYRSYNRLLTEDIELGFYEGSIDLFVFTECFSNFIWILFIPFLTWLWKFGLYSCFRLGELDYEPFNEIWYRWFHEYYTFMPSPIWHAYYVFIVLNIIYWIVTYFLKKNNLIANKINYILILAKSPSLLAVFIDFIHNSFFYLLGLVIIHYPKLIYIFIYYPLLFIIKIVSLLGIDILQVRQICLDIFNTSVQLSTVDAMLYSKIEDSFFRVKFYLGLYIYLDIILIFIFFYLTKVNFVNLKFYEFKRYILSNYGFFINWDLVFKWYNYAYVIILFSVFNAIYSYFLYCVSMSQYSNIMGSIAIFTLIFVNIFIYGYLITRDLYFKDNNKSKYDTKIKFKSFFKSNKGYKTTFKIISYIYKYTSKSIKYKYLNKYQIARTKIQEYILKISYPLVLIVPALNLAVCWKLCYNNTQSAGNLSSLHEIGILRGYTPEFICRKNLGVNNCFIPYVTIRRYVKMNYMNNGIKLPKSGNYNTHFAQYITGLIEGNGTIHVPKTVRSVKGTINYPSIQIVFHLKDLPLALLIQKELGHGSLSKKKGANAYIYTVNNLEGLILLVSLLNGNMKTNKIEVLHRLIDWYNQYRNTTFEKKGFNTDSLTSNAWLSGFIEAYGYFSIRSTESAGKNPKIECKFELSQRRKDENQRDNLFFLNEIAICFESLVKLIRNDSNNPQYRVRTTNLKGNLAVVDYLTIYPLFGTKYSDYKDWVRVVQLFKEKPCNHKANMVYVKSIKSGMNDKRTLFVWDHLQNFYNLNK